MKKFTIWNLAFLTLTLSSIALADGGVGSGGGGTTNPSPANPEHIWLSAHLYGAKIITAWLHKKEDEFNHYKEADQKISPLAKLFRPSGGKNIYDLLIDTEIEFRMNEPCRDFVGNPVDGSIYGTRPGSICLSPFSMAPKLSEINANAETIALLIHEFSHLVGANEEEAVKLQQAAIWDFSRFDMFDALSAIDVLATPKMPPRSNEINILMTELHILKAQLENGRMRYRDFSSLAEQFGHIRRKISIEFRYLLFISPAISKLLVPHALHLDIPLTFACANDVTEPDHQKWCQDKLDKGFGSEESSSLLIYLARLSDSPESTFPAEYSLLEARRPRSAPDLVFYLDSLEQYLVALQVEVDHLRDLQLNFYRN
ncbi:MAG: hypothetical protein AB7K68_09480 [Bacteriovoracia bacterium]